jgi:hypothetical protein
MSNSPQRQWATLTLSTLWLRPDNLSRHLNGEGCARALVGRTGSAFVERCPGELWHIAHRVARAACQIERVVACDAVRLWQAKMWSQPERVDYCLSRCSWRWWTRDAIEGNDFDVTTSRNEAYDNVRLRRSVVCRGSRRLQFIEPVTQFELARVPQTLPRQRIGVEFDAAGPPLICYESFAALPWVSDRCRGWTRSRLIRASSTEAERSAFVTVPRKAGTRDF